MSLGHGAKIVTDGLVFAYDMDNTKKCFKGKPTTNLVNQPTRAFSNWAGLTGTSEEYTTKKNRRGVKLQTLSGGGVQWYNTGGQKNVSASTEYTVSARIRYSGGTPHPNMFYLREYNSSGSQVREAGHYSSGSQYALGDGWYFAYRTMTTQGTTAKMLVQGYQYAGGITIEIEDVQLELGNIATSYIDGTRSNTEAIIDQVGGATITANNLTYSSDNTFSFNGSNSSLTGDYTTTVRNTINQPPYSVSCWVYKPSSSTAAQVVYDADSTRFNLNFNHYVAGKWSFDFYGGTEVILTAPGNYDNQWTNFIVVHRSTGTMEFWVNGELVASQANVNSIAANGANFIIGNRIQGGMAFNGSMSNFVVYNKALTANEIKNNFAALRGRYGI